jgi:hypothetical protein
MYSAYKDEYRIFRLFETTIRNRLRQKEEKIEEMKCHKETPCYN